MGLSGKLRQTDIAADRMTDRFVKKELIPTYKESLKEIRNKMSAFYEKYAKDGRLSRADVTQYNRLNALEKDIEKELNRLGGRVKRKQRTALMRTYAETRNRAAFAVEAEAQVKLGYRVLPKEQVEAAVIGRVNWADSVDDATRAAVRQVKNSIAQGIAQGKAYTEVASEISERLGVAAGRAERIARTEGHRCREAGKMRALEHADEKGVKFEKIWTATLDDATRDTHGDMDGQAIPMYDEDGDPAEFESPEGHRTQYPGDFGVPEEDINCRCAVRAEIKDMEPKVRRAREEGKIPYTSYEDYAKSKGWETPYAS